MTSEASQTKEPVELRDLSNHFGLREHVSDETQSNNGSDAPTHAVDALQKWNQSKSNIFKTMSTFFGFIIMGANDAAYG